MWEELVLFGKDVSMLACSKYFCHGFLILISFGKKIIFNSSAEGLFLIFGQIETYNLMNPLM